jgi:hypothetical protein
MNTNPDKSIDPVNSLNDSHRVNSSELSRERVEELIASLDLRLKRIEDRFLVPLIK